MILLLLSMFFLPGCSKPYTLQGRVVKSEYPMAEFIDQVKRDPEAIPGFGIPNARIEIVRDPRSLGRKVVSTGKSDADGIFVVPIDAFGAGWMEEEWLFRCTHPNYPMLELFGELPSIDRERILVFELGLSGGPGTGGRPLDEQERIQRELDRYGR